MPPNKTNQATSRGSATQNVQATDPDPNYGPPESSQRNMLNESEESVFKRLFWTGYWAADIDSISPVMSGPKRRALVIAVSYGVRSPPSPLSGTFIDAYKIIKLLVSKFEYLHEDICVLADVEDEVGRQDPRRSPDQRNIEQALRWLCTGSKAEDYRFLFFAGHGYRRTEHLPTSIYEGIMPSDTSFKSFVTCEDCACGIADGVSVFQSQKGKVIPHPATIIWGYRINEILASSLADGANLTVLFDCCHSGGTLSNSFADARDIIGSPVPRGWLSYPFDVVRGFFGGATQQPLPLEGNFLCLPRGVELKAEVTPVLKPTLTRTLSALSSEEVPSHRAPNTRKLSVAEQACVPHQRATLTVREFGQSCRILCWAACRGYQYSWGDDSRGGFFTDVFVKHLTETSRSTYSALNNRIREEFRSPIQVESSETVYQRPQMFVSDIMGRLQGGENKFEEYVDI